MFCVKVGKAGPLIENTSWWAEKPLTRRCPRREGLKELIKILSHLHKALQPWGLFCLLGIKDHRGAQGGGGGLPEKEDRGVGLKMLYPAQVQGCPEQPALHKTLSEKRVSTLYSKR